MSSPGPVAAKGAPFLEIRNIVKAFDEVRAVNDVSVTINKGEIFALLGSSGCGKSTLLRMLAGFETPTSGQILLGGQDLAGLAPYERPINMMFQSYALFPHLNVWDNIAFGLRRDGLRWIPQVNGIFRIPVVSLHTLGDLYVPFHMQQIFRERAERQQQAASRPPAAGEDAPA